MKSVLKIRGEGSKFKSHLERAKMNDSRYFLHSPSLKGLPYVNYIHGYVSGNVPQVQSMVVGSSRDQEIALQIHSDNRRGKTCIYAIEYKGREVIAKVFNDEKKLDMKETFTKNTTMFNLSCLSHLDGETIMAIAAYNNKKADVVYKSGTTIKIPIMFKKIYKPQVIKSNEIIARKNVNIVQGDLVTDNYAIPEFINMCHASTLNSLGHRHFLDVYSFHLEKNPLRQIMLMEKVDGCVEDYLDELDDDDMIKIIFQAVYCLGLLWDKFKMVHGDLHLDNVFIKWNGEPRPRKGNKTRHLKRRSKYDDAENESNSNDDCSKSESEEKSGDYDNYEGSESEGSLSESGDY